MAGFFYFLPGVGHQFGSQNLEAFGLSHILDEGFRLHHRDVSQGIHNQPGVIVTSSANFDQTETKFRPEIQWKPFPKPYAEQQAYCGWLPGELPKPADLARKSMLPGEWLTCAAGNSWLIPIARQTGENGWSIALPQIVDLNEVTGKLELSKVHPRYQRLWSHVENYGTAYANWFEALRTDVNAPLSVSFDESFYADVFAANYRVSLRELTILAAIGTGMAQSMVDILTDEKGFQALKKKSGPRYWRFLKWSAQVRAGRPSDYQPTFADWNELERTWQPLT